MESTFVYSRDMKLVQAGVPVTTIIGNHLLSLDRNDSQADTFVVHEDVGVSVAMPMNFCETDRTRYNWRKGCTFRNSHGSRGRKPQKPRQLPGAQKRTLH